MGIETLSTENLLQIMELLVIPSNKLDHPPGFNEPKHLNSLMRCLKNFQGLGEPILYRTYTQKSPAGLIQFLRTVISRPNLLQYVRRVHLSFVPTPTGLQSQFINLLGGVGHGVFTTSEGREIARRVHTRNPQGDFAGAWLGKICQGLWEGTAPLVISMIPNLEELRITNCTHGFNDSITYLKYVFSSSTRTPKKLAIRCEETEYRNPNRVSLKTIVDLLGSRNIESFECSNLREGSSEEDEGGYGTLSMKGGWNNLPPLQFNIKSLQLKASNLSTGTIKGILQSCPHLEHVTYQHEQHCKEYPFRPRKFMDSIIHLKSTLQELAVYQASPSMLHGNSAAYAADEDHCMGSLAEFTKLRELSLCSKLLPHPPFPVYDYGWYSRVVPDPLPEIPLVEFFPASLEELRIRGCEFKVVLRMTEFLAWKATLFPHLKKLTLGFLLGNSCMQGSSPRAVSPFATSSDFLTPWKASREEERVQMRDLEDVCRRNEVRLAVVNIKRSYLNF